jgi:murein L,D-transpeptidase YafK
MSHPSEPESGNVSQTAQTIRPGPSGKPFPQPISEIYFRAFKAEDELEIWFQSSPDEQYTLYHTYRVLKSSGKPGPKRKEGDRQVPEGFYTINRFNPNSKFHLSLGLDYPNQSDLIRSDQTRPGSDIFIHGSNVSIGCLAMGDDAIEEIYALAKLASKKIRVDIFPYRMEPETHEMKIKQHPEFADFWTLELLPAYRNFNATHQLADFTIDYKGAYIHPD